MADKEKPRKRNESKHTKRGDTCEISARDCGKVAEEIRPGPSSDERSRQVGNSSEEGKTADSALTKAEKKEKRKKEKYSRKLAELTEAFHLFDFDRDGIISFSDLKRVYASLDRGEVDDEQISQMIAEGLSPLDFDAFVKLMGYKTLDLDDEEVLVEALSQWDYGTGLISEERIRHDLMTWGDKFTEEEVTAALELAPIVVTDTKEKMINYVQFSNDLCGFPKAKGLKGK